MTTYEELRSGAVEILVAGRPVPVVDKDRLVAMKLACGRPKDLVDVAQLTGREADR